MYSNVSFIRRHVVKVSLNDFEEELIDQICHTNGVQKAAFIRDCVLESLRHVPNHGAQRDAMQRTQQAA